MELAAATHTHLCARSLPGMEDRARINALKRRLADADDTLSVANYKDIGRILHRRHVSVKAALPDGKKGPYSYQDIVDVRDKLYEEGESGEWKDTIDQRKGENFVVVAAFVRFVAEEVNLVVAFVFDGTQGLRNRVSTAAKLHLAVP